MSVAFRLVTLSALICFSVRLLAAQATSTPPTQVQQHIQKVTTCLRPLVLVKDDPQPCTPLAERMAQLHVPGVSIAVIHNGSIEWARGFGVKQIGGAAVDPDTLFQAGSISKPVAALAALHLVQEGKLSLDADVNTELVNWKVPPSPFAHGNPVTLRELLTHTAGFTVHGFPGYAANAPVPTLIEVLDGRKPANTLPIRLQSEPGGKWNYSGGGYAVMQQILVDVAKEPFPTLLHDVVLVPVGMTHSTYQQPLPLTFQSDAATPYRDDGTAVAGGAHTYPEMAAAGLWTTPSDLARYEIEVERSLDGKANHVLSKELTQQMLTPGKGEWGLGVEIGGSATDPYFTHGGANEGFRNEFVAYEHHGDGAVVMTNSDNGVVLLKEIIESIATEYGWPDFHPVIRTQVKVDHGVLARYVGTYQFDPKLSIAFSLDGDQLEAQATNRPKFSVFPESPTKFFEKIVDAQFEFFTDDKGHVSYMVLYSNGQSRKFVKK